MANILKIKRSATTATPTSLAEGELAYSENSSNLFIGTNGGVDIAKIGGNADVLKLAGIDAGAQVNTVDDVNGQTGNVSLGLQDLNDVTFAASPNLAADDLIVFDGANWINVPKTDVGVTSHNDLTDIGITSHADIDTHIAAINPHNNWMSVNNNVDLSSAPSSSTFNGIGIGDSAISGGTNTIAIGSGAHAYGASSIAFGQSATASGDNSIAIGGAGSYAGNFNAIAIGSGSVVRPPDAGSIAIGGITTSAAGQAIIGTSATNILAIENTGNVKIIGTNAQFVQPNYTTAGLPVGVTGGTVFDTTTTSLKVYNGAAWVDVSPDLSPYALDADVVHNTGAETIAGAKTFSDDMIINGDLNVNGTTTTVDSDNLVITDNIITVNAGETGAGVTLGTSGILVDRGTAGDTQWVWDETSDMWGYVNLDTGSPATGTFVAMSDENHLHTGVYEPVNANILRTTDIGVTVQGYDATILVDADIGVNVQAYDATILVDADIGVNVQAYNAATALTSDITYETLDTNGDVGTGAGQLAIGNHNHDAAYMAIGVTIDGGTF